MPMSDEEFQAFHDERWSELDPDLKRRARDILHAFYPVNTWEQVRVMYAEEPAHWMAGHHHFFGMGVRNLLRTGNSPQKDTGLPGIPDDQLPSGNWDDYYVAALEYAAGIRSQ